MGDLANFEEIAFGLTSVEKALDSGSGASQTEVVTKIRARLGLSSGRLLCHTLPLLLAVNFGSLRCSVIATL